MPSDARGQPSARWLLAGLAAALLAACDGEPDRDPGAGGAGAGSGTGAAGHGPGAPTGPGDGDWRKAFHADGVGIDCDMTLAELQAAGAPSITVGATRLVVGFQQYADNQDPVLVRFDGEEQIYCEHHEQDPPDGRARGISWDGGPMAYLVYTVVGGGTALDSLAAGGWISRYGDGGNSSAVTVLGAVETTWGTVERATFVLARRDGGTKTNTLRPADAITVLESGELELLGFSAFAPLNPDQSVMCLPDTEYPSAFDGGEGPNYLGRFTADLTSAVCASTAGCSNQAQPCS